MGKQPTNKKNHNFFPTISIIRRVNVAELDSFVRNTLVAGFETIILSLNYLCCAIADRIH